MNVSIKKGEKTLTGKRTKATDIDLIYEDIGQALESKKEEKKKERERRIKEQKKQENKEEFDYDTELVIKMTNRNKMIKDEEIRKIRNKEAIKRKRRNRKIKFIIKAVATIGITAGVMTFALTSPIFSIYEINVINNEIVPKDTVISLSGLKTEENLFKFIKIAAIEKIKEEPYIENAKIRRKLPNTIEIEVEERKPQYEIKLLESYAYISEQGYILEISSQSQGMPIIQGLKIKDEEITAGMRLEHEDLETLEDIIKIMNLIEKYKLDIKVTNIDIDAKNGYSIYVAEEKKTIHLGNSTSLNDKIRNAIKIMEEEKDIEGEIFVNGDLSGKFQPYFREKV